MKKNSVNIVLAKINRASAWVLFVLVAVYIITALSMMGYLFNSIIDANTALKIHENITILVILIIVLVIHTALCLYLRFKNWRRKK